MDIYDPSLYAGNPYRISNPAMFDAVLAALRDYPEHYATVLSHSRKDAGDWLNETLAPVLAAYEAERQGYKVPTRDRIWLMLRGASGPAKCPTCGKIAFRRVASISQGRPPYCSCKCASASPDSTEKVARTKAARYGDPAFNNRAKFSETVAAMPEGKRAAWREAFAETCRTRYGADSYMATDEFRRRSEQWVAGKYGPDYYNVLQVPEVRAENRRRNLERRGHPAWSNWEKGRETCMRNHGVDVIFKDDGFRREQAARAGEISKKRRETLAERFGVPFPPAFKYEYEGETYDSRPELAFAVWAKDHGVKAERCRGDGFQFEYGGKTHRYLPDFKTGGGYVELKGDHFFREDGTMFCPYRYPEWTDEQYEDACGLYEAKRQCMLANGVRIVRTPEYAEYVKYAEGAYGADFFEKCRKSRSGAAKPPPPRSK